MRGKIAYVEIWFRFHLFETATRKVVKIAKLQPVAMAAGYIGCMTLIGIGTATLVVHTVKLLDWARGGPAPHSWDIPAALVTASEPLRAAPSPLAAALLGWGAGRRPGSRPF